MVFLFICKPSAQGLLQYQSELIQFGTEEQIALFKLTDKQIIYYWVNFAENSEAKSVSQ